MTERRTMRASDRDREQVVTRLRGAFEEGRLKMDEYLARMETAMQAVTYGELAGLCDDLPSKPPAPAPVPHRAGRAPVLASVASLPGVLKVLWTIWLVAVSVNVVVWALVSGTHGHLAYPWPLWVAGPYGAVLFAISATVTGFRRCRAWT
jgi:hypothetical protein